MGDRVAQAFGGRPHRGDVGPRPQHLAGHRRQQLTRQCTAQTRKRLRAPALRADAGDEHRSCQPR